MTDLENCADFISSIIDLEILNRPKDGLVGSKWTETRKMFGKEASETMWITEAVMNEYYCTRAESHGSVYLTKMSLIETGDKTLLTMSFSAEAQSTVVKFLSVCMEIFIKSAMRKALLKDLEDIKKHVEQI